LIVLRSFRLFVKENFEIIIIGSGFGGQIAAINLLKQGISDFLILERRSFIGGTWSQNTYPGAAVDVPSPLYSVASEPYDWSQLYAEREELNDYTQLIINKYLLDKKIQIDSNVTKIAWDDLSGYWNISIDNKNTLKSKFIINASGPLSTPIIPDFKGREKFLGSSFHSNNWNHDLDLKGKRVAIIGSGASAAQIIPSIATKVKELKIFQRSPHWVIPRKDYKFKNWQRYLLRNRFIYKILRTVIYWALEYRMIGFKYSQKLLNVLGRRQSIKMVHQQITDPELRRKVIPDFSFGCKRVIISNTLYPAYCRQNVELLDKDNGIKEITENGIISYDGIEHRLDLIIYSTGYDATDGVISYPVIGRNGTLLSDVWSDYPRAYLGTAIPKFPNLFIVTGPNTGIGHTSALFIIESQLKYILNCIQQAKKQNKKVIEVTEKAEQDYTTLIHKEMEKTVWHKGGCNSWYKSKSGKIIAMFPGFSFTYRRWAKDFKMKDHTFSDL